METRIGQRIWHRPKPRLLTSWAVKRSGSWSAQIAWHKSEVTYILRGEGRGELVSADRMARIRGHLHTARWGERGIVRGRWHVTKPRRLKDCQVEEEGNWSGQIECHETEATYRLRGEGRGELVSADRMARIRGHLRTAR